MARARTELFPERIQELSSFARALGHPARVSIVTLLQERGETAAMDLVRALPLSQPASSLHLKALKRAGLVRTREHGAQVRYSLNRGFVRSLSQALHKSVTAAPAPARSRSRS